MTPDSGNPFTFHCHTLGAESRIRGAGDTHTGMERDHNEDFYGADPERGLFIVADGLGGHNAGETASRMAVETLLSYYDKAEEPWTPDTDRAALRHAHETIQSMSQTSPELFGMGTTVVVLRLDGAEIHAFGVGDSSVFLFRDERLLKVIPSPPVGVYGLLQQIVHGRAENRHIVSCALGPSRELTIDAESVSVRNGDVFLMCSDGLTNMVTEHRIRALLSRHQEDPKTCCRRLIEDANQAGGMDNITGLLVRIQDAGVEAEKNETIQLDISS